MANQFKKNNKEIDETIDMMDVKIISLERRLNDKISKLENIINEKSPNWDKCSKTLFGK